MAYDRDSFLAGLAVGRTLWRPHRDIKTATPTLNYILSPDDLSAVWSGERQLSEFVERNYQSQYYRGIYVDNNNGLCIHSDSNTNKAYQFYEPIPARANKVYIELSAVQAFAQYHQFVACVNDAQGVPGYYADNAFAGNRLRTVYLVSYTLTTEQMNSQEDVTFEYLFTTPLECVRQTIVIDVSDIAVNSYIGFQNVDSNAYVYAIWWSR